MNHKCTVRGCYKQLDEHGYPVEYCDFQQGRCPMQKVPVDFNPVLFYVILFVVLFGVIWYHI
jgi:hypothetical protein